MIEGLTSIIGPQSDFSFPSGHTAGSFALVSVLWLLAPKKVSIPSTVLATLISLSRLYVGVHYPTDILGGALIGSICGIAAVYFVKWLWKNFDKKKENA